MLNFPLYAVRRYTEIFEQSNYKIITTHRSRYVLDLIDSKKKDYVSRRLDIIRDKLKPYELYPIDRRITTKTEYILSKYDTFIDKYGKLIKKKKSKFYKVHHSKIQMFEYTDRGHTLLRCKGCPENFVVPKHLENYAYASYIKYGSEYILLDLSNSDKPFKIRVKV